MSAVEKSEILALVTESGLSRRGVLAQLGVSRSIYYRRLRRQAEGRLQDKKGGSTTPWNKLRPEEESKILDQARASPELSARQLALRIVDSEDLFVSESTVTTIKSDIRCCVWDLLRPACSRINIGEVSDRKCK